ncbi:MAG: selenoneine synthase SenA [Pseudomonadota bacterium]
MTNHSFRTASPSQLAEALLVARRHTLTLFDAFSAAGLDTPDQVPIVPLLDPPLWSLGHIAWFAEWYVLREAQSSNPVSALRSSLLTKGDDWFDPNTVPHRARWTLGLPSGGALKTYCHEVLDRTLDKLSRAASHDAALKPYRLALAHEDMVGESLVQALQVLGVVAPPQIGISLQSTWAQGEIRFPGGTIALGSAPGHGFVFDNEKWAHECYVPAFQMDSTLISNAQFAEFVADGGYQNRQFWSVSGQAWLMQQERSVPRYWRRDGLQWRCLRFGEVRMAIANEAVRHLSLFEAQAYCAWAKRRLPSEAEWEFAALSGHAAMRWGDLWEWTATPFEPYPGLAADKDQGNLKSTFATHQVLRGASFATPLRMRSAKFRHVYLPQRDDIFAGFRTCAL